MLSVLLRALILRPAPEAALLPLGVLVLCRRMVVRETVAVGLAVLHELRVEALEDIDGSRRVRLWRG